MSEYLPPVVAQLTGDIGDFLDKIAEAEAAIASLEGKSVDINFNTSTTAEADALNQVVQDAERVKETLLSIEDLRPWEAINSSAAITQLRLIDAQLAQTRADAVIDLVLNTDQAEAALTQVEDKLLTMEDLQPWGSVNDSVFQAQMASIDATLAQTKADAIATAAALALAETGGLGGGGGTEGGGGGGGGEGGGGGGLIAGLGGNTANIMAAVHAIHIFLPEILGLGAALAVSAAGFISLGVASYGTVKGIYAGYSAVSAASDALSAAIPGTTQWTAAVGQMGTAWSSIPTALQPAVGAINNLISKMGSSPLGQEVRSWVVGQVGTLTHMFAGAGSAFTPLIEATQRAVDTTEGVLAKLMGSSGFRGMLSRMSAMVGPAVMQLGELGLALGKIAYGFIKAIQGGAGMNTLVQIFRTLANIVNSSFFQGFVAGWVAFDRIVATVIGWAFRLLGVLSSLGLNIKGLGEVLGFVVSGFAMWIAVTSVIGWIRNLGGASQTAAVDVEAVGTASADAVAGIEDAGTAAETTGTEMEAGGAGAMGFAKSLMGPAALIFGVTGLAQSLGKLTGIANPIGSLFHSIGGAIQFVSHGFTNTDSTTRAYTKSLHGAIYGTEQLSKAQDMLVRSEQSIGGSLGAMANGLQQWSLTSVTATVTAAGGWGKYVAAATSSVNSMVTLLQNKNGSLATWAADAQILIKRGMDPSAVASMAQQAPQDLASMVKGSTAQLHDFNVQTQAQLLLATMSGSQGIKGMTAQMAKDFKNGTPAIKAAAAQVATQLGAALGHPFTGTMSSINQISNALNTMPASVVQALAGKLHQIAPAATAAAKATTTLKGATQNTSSTIMSMVMDVGMIGLGLKGTMPLLSSAGTTVANFAKSLLGMGPAGDVAAEGEVAAGTGAEDASAGFLALDASAGIILLAIAAVGIAAYEIYKHWSGVSHFFVGVWDEIKRIFDAAMTFIKAHLSIFAEVLGSILLGPMGFLVAFIATHWNTVKRITLAAWNAVKGYILPPVHEVVSTVTGAFGRFEGFIATTWQHITTRTSVAWNDFKSFIISVLQDVRGVVVATMHIIGEVVSVASGIIEGVVKAAWQVIKGATQTTWQLIQAVIKVAWDVISGIVHAALPFITTFIKIQFGIISAIVKGVWDVIVAIVKFAWAIIGTVVKVAVGVVEDVIRVFAALLTANWGALWNAIKNLVSTVWGGITAIVGAAINLVVGVVSAFGNTIAGIWDALWGGVVSTVKDTWNLVTGAIGAGISAIIGAFKGAGSWLFDVGKNIVMGLANGIKSMIGAVTGAISHVAHGVTSIAHKILGIFSPSTVFAEIGRNVTQGFANGILGAAGVAHNAVMQMSTGAIAAGRMGGNMTGIGSTLGAQMSGMGVNPVSASAAANAQPIILQVTTPLQINGQVLANAVTKYMLRNARSQNTALGQYSGSSMAAGATGINVNAVQR